MDNTVRLILAGFLSCPDPETKLTISKMFVRYWAIITTDRSMPIDENTKSLPWCFHDEESTRENL